MKNMSKALPRRQEQVRDYPVPTRAGGRQDLGQPGHPARAGQQPPRAGLDPAGAPAATAQGQVELRAVGGLEDREAGGERGGVAGHHPPEGDDRGRCGGTGISLPATQEGTQIPLFP